jgi:hypothetical protein
MSTLQKQAMKAQTADLTRTRGTGQPPQPPRDIICQPGPRGMLVTWNLPSGFSDDIQRWRVYKDDENTLYHEVTDRGTRQMFVETTAGTNPVVTNVFVSSLNALGIESKKTQGQGQAAAETGAPVMPPVPPGFNSGFYGGGSTGTNYKSGNKSN